jgi:hypothetical protein
MNADFQEIALSGGQIIVSFRNDADGHRTSTVGFTHSRPVPCVLTEWYALPQGIVAEPLPILGMGQAQPRPSIPGCYPVFLRSDSHGKFGHNCPHCREYWRSGPMPNVCPYCAHEDQSHAFFSDAQKRYVMRYCELFGDALQQDSDAQVVIDLDAVANATGTEGEKPVFYRSERSQQRQFVCAACEEFNDILGHFGYCSLCGTRNDVMVFEEETIKGIRDRLNAGGDAGQAVKDAVGAFDTVAGQYAKQIARMVPITARRRQRLEGQRYHDFDEVSGLFNNWFDIDLLDGMTASERAFAKLRFHRRHLFEHNGGEADQRYLDASGDVTVKVKQVIKESREDVHSLLGSLVKMVRNLHAGFHELIPPREGPIKAFKEKKERIARYQQQPRS